MVFEKPTDEQARAASSFHRNALEKNQGPWHQQFFPVYGRKPFSTNNLQIAADRGALAECVVVISRSNALCLTGVFLIIGDHRHAEGGRDRAVSFVRFIEGIFCLIEPSVEPVKTAGILWIQHLWAIGMLGNVPIGELTSGLKIAPTGAFTE